VVNGLLRLGRSRFFPLSRAAVRLGFRGLYDSPKERLESLCSASTFRGVTRQSLKRRFLCLRFFHGSIAASIVRVVVFLAITILCFSNVVAITKGCPMLAVKNIGIVNATKHEQSLVVSNVVDLFLTEGRTLHRISRHFVLSVWNQDHRDRLFPILRRIKESVEVGKRVFLGDFGLNCDLSMPRKRLPGILKLDVNNEGLPRTERAICSISSNPSALVKTSHFPRQTQAVSGDPSSFSHLVKLATVDKSYDAADEENRELHPIMPSLPVRLICSLILCITGWYIGYRGRLAWDRRHFVRAIAGFILLVCFAGLAVHVFFYL
jgi:hypothetical protein